MIELQHVYKAYKGKSVLVNVSLTIRSGEFFVLIGSSGCGKTTLLKTINKLNALDKGEVLIDGTSVQQIKVSQLPRLVGYVVPLLIAGGEYRLCDGTESGCACKGCTCTSCPCCTSRMKVPPIEITSSSGWGENIRIRLG